MIYTVEMHGKVYTVLGMRDMMELIDGHMGSEFRTVLEEMLAETYAEEAKWASIEDGHNRELDEVREHFRSTVSEIHEESERLAELIRKKRLDRAAISGCAGRIGTAAWRAL